MNVLLGVVWVAAVGALYWLDVIAGRPAVALIILAAACCAAVVAACRIRDEREAWKQLRRDRGELVLARFPFRAFLAGVLFLLVAALVDWYSTFGAFVSMWFWAILDAWERP